MKSRKTKSQKSTGKAGSRARKAASAVRRAKGTAKKASKKVTKPKPPAPRSRSAQQKGQAKKTRVAAKTGRPTTAGTLKSSGSTAAEKYAQSGAPWWKAYL